MELNLTATSRRETAHPQGFNRRTAMREPMVLRKFYPMKLYVLDNIMQERLSLSRPSKFNDPFDCALLRDKAFLENLQDKERNYINRLRTLCLFKVDKALSNYDDIQRYFWAFYGDSHRGVCIEIAIPHEEFKEMEEGDSIPDEKFTETEKDGRILKITPVLQKLDLSTKMFAKKVEYRPNIIKEIIALKNTTNRTDFFQIIKNGAFLKDEIFCREDEYRIFKVCDSEADYDFFQ